MVVSPKSVYETVMDRFVYMCGPNPNDRDIALLKNPRDFPEVFLVLAERHPFLPTGGLGLDVM
jgi:hypothetical protein